MFFSGTILLSRQPLRPCGKDAWVVSTVNAVKWLKTQDITLYSSIGMPTWELITGLGTIHNLNMKLFVPCSGAREFESLSQHAAEQFDLDPANTQILPVFPEIVNTGKKSLMQRRDKFIVDQVQVVVPVSFRQKGYMRWLVDCALREGKSVVEDFTVPYKPRRSVLAYKIEPKELNKDIDRVGDDYVVHWTRTSNSAWPTERLIDFYRDVLLSDCYPRSAFHTLNHIVDTGVIKASSKHMPGNIPTVSFSTLPPRELAALVSWRARYRQMSFEPYGIGIEQKTAEDLGIQPVKYYDKGEPTGAEEQRWLTQSRGVKSDWSLEQEYRYKGDLDISQVSADKKILFCHTCDEADCCTEETGIRTIAFVKK